MRNRPMKHPTSCKHQLRTLQATARYGAASQSGTFVVSSNVPGKLRHEKLLKAGLPLSAMTGQKMQYSRNCTDMLESCESVLLLIASKSTYNIAGNILLILLVDIHNAADLSTDARGCPSLGELCSAGPGPLRVSAVLGACFRVLPAGCAD